MAIKFSEGPVLSNKQASVVMKKLAEETLAPPKPAKRVKGAGRPASGKETVTLRLDARVVAYYKSFGDDWRQAMIDDLKKASYG